MANGCYTLAPGDTPLYFKPTALGRYLLYTPARRFVAARGTTGAPGDADDLDRPPPRRPHHAQQRRRAAAAAAAARRSGSPAPAAAPPTPSRRSTSAAARTPGSRRTRRSAGYVDAHIHVMAFEFLGGDVHCGKPWDRYGVAVRARRLPRPLPATASAPCSRTALSRQPAHARPGRLADLQGLAGTGLADPREHLLQVARARLARRPADLREPARREQRCSARSTRSSRTPATRWTSSGCRPSDIYELQDYIDAQSGGPGKGFFRIVTDPFQARAGDQRRQAGRGAGHRGLASRSAAQSRQRPAAVRPPASIDRGSTRSTGSACAQMEIVNKFDNALAGVAGDNGTTGVVVNNGNKLETGHYWDMQTCTERRDGAPTTSEQLAAEFTPQHGRALRRRSRGLAAASRRRAALPAPGRTATPRPDDARRAHDPPDDRKRHMIFDPDHMSVLARKQALDLLEALALLRASSPATVVARPTPTRASTSSAASSRRTPATRPTSSRSGALKPLGRPALLLGLRLRRRHERLRRPGRPARRRGAPNRSPTRSSRSTAGHARPASTPASASTTSTPTASPTTASTRTGSRTCASIAGDADRRGHGARRRGLPADVGARRGHRPGLVPQPGAAARVATARRRVRAGMTTRQVMEAVGQPWTRLGGHSTFCATAPGPPTCGWR